MTPVISCSPVSKTPAINPCHGFSVIAGVVDPVTNFSPLPIVNDTGEQLSLVKV
jgi:hypothetical protein